MADRQDVIAPSPARMLFESTTPTDDPLRELPPTTGAITPTGRHTSSVTRNFKLAEAQFFRGRSDSGPSTNRPTRRRGSAPREPDRKPGHRALELLLPAGGLYAVTPAVTA
ncbi:hypothetical protein [Streptomyces sp. NPDC088719]|uniref:hypothetical protein n=1 Tax=Streptomyces sp. NPDC088719 TaxID=3365872 RepID=UPI0037F20B24